MTLLNTINVGGTDFKVAGVAILGSCPTPAGSEVKVCTFTDDFELEAGDMLLVKFTYANTYGDGSTTYPKLQVNGTNYTMRRADGNYIAAGEWDNNATLTFLFDGTDFILPAGSLLLNTVDVVEEGNLHAVTSNAVAEAMSYSTSEVATGKKWIDGKDIYRKVLTTTSAINTDSFYWGGLETEVQNLNISSVINVSGVDNTYGKTFRPMGFSSSSGFSTFSTGLAQGANIIIEYTKTTP
jgi:hypothetical protein